MKTGNRKKLLVTVTVIFSLLLIGTSLAQKNSAIFSAFAGSFLSATPTPQPSRPKRKTARTVSGSDKTNDRSSLNKQTPATESNLAQILASVDFNLIGLVGTVNPATQTVPKNIPTGVLTSIQVPEGTDPAPIIAQLNPNYRIRGELTGPSFTAPRVVEARIGQPIQIPPMPNTGDHVLQNLRIIDITDATNATLAPVAPDSVGITVIDNILVTQVQVTEMTYEQIIQSGINLNNSNYNFYNFTIGLGTTSGAIPIQIPVALPSTAGQPPVVGNPTGGVSPSGVSVPMPDIVPVMLEGVDGEGNPSRVELPGGGQVQIPGVVVFPGRIGLLHQFFEAIVIVANGAPNGTPLVVTNLKAKAKLPDANTPNDPADDPLKIAETQQGGVQTQLEIHGLGPDGRYGTADDTVSFNPGQSGQAAFLLEGLKEGLHTVDFDLEGTLQGLPTGNLAIRGSVPGAVLVRDAEFGVTFTHPAVVRAGQEYDLGLTIFNSGNRNLNGIALNLRGDSVSGATLIDSEIKTLNQTIAPGTSGTVKWRLRSNTTGQVTASYIKVGEDILAGLNLVTGVGDRNVPLSPDSLILPDPVKHLPPTVVEAARQMLGQAWSVATAPAGSLPAGVLPVDKQTVVSKAVELGWAGLRIDFHEDRDTSLRTLLRDWMGENSTNSSAGFADALRNTPAGYYFYDVVGTKFFETVGTESPADFHKKLAAAESSRSAFVSAYVSQSGGQQILGAKINSPTNQSVGFGANSGQRFGDLRTGASLNLLETDPHDASNNSKGNFLIVSKPTTTGNWSLEVNGWADGSADISVLAPTSGKNYRQIIFAGVAITAGKRYRISFRASGTAAPFVEEFVNGAFVPANLPFTSADVNDPSPEITGIVQVTEDVIEGGDKFGRLVGVLFSKPMVKASAETPTRYQIGGGGLSSDPSQIVGKLIKPTSAVQNFGSRFTILALDSPVGPYIKRNVTANGIADAAGKTINNSTKDIEPRVSPQGNPPGGYLTGRVMQADGTAVPNAGVYYRRMKPSPLVPGSRCGLLSDWETVSYQKADSNGEFTIDYVREGDCHPVTVLFQNPATNSEKTLVSNVAYNGQHLIFNAVFLARGNVQGTVTSGGVPLANANVSIISELDALNNKLVKTNAQGFYSATGVPVGGVTVKAVGTGSYSLSSGIAAGNLGEAGGTTTIDVTTQNVAGVIKGKVLDSGTEQKPVQNSLVVARAHIPGFPTHDGRPLTVGYAFTQADGSFSIDKLPVGIILLEATDPQRGVATSITVALTAQTPKVENVILLVNNGFGRVLGKVVNEIGAVIPNAVVQNGTQAVQADSSGNYVLPQVKEGNVSITATDPVTRQKGSTTVSVRRNEDTTGADIVIRRPANLNGQVFITQNGTTTPLAQAFVSVDGIKIVRTDSQGRYTLNDLQSGADLTIRFVHPQGRLFVNTNVFLNPGETLSRNATFRPARVHGKVTQPDGVTPVVTSVSFSTSRPHLNPDIYFGLPVEATLTYQTTTDGLYSFETLNPINYRVSTSNVFFPIPVSQSGILPPNADLEINLSLVDSLAGKIHGHIFQPDGTTPVGAGVKVSLGGGSLSDVTVRTDASGYYEFAEVFAEGGYTLKAVDPVTNRTNQTGVSVRKNQEITVDLRLLGRGNLKVKVLDGGGSPLQTGSIRVEGSGYPNDQRYIELTPAHNGEFEFTNLTEGTYAVSALYLSLGGRVSGTVTIGGTTIVTVQVQAVGSITGRVFMPDGTTPVGLADVTLRQNGRIIGLITSQDSEEERGKFNFTYVPTGDFTVDVFDNRTGRSGRSAGTITTQGQVANVNVNLLALGTVVGQVTSNGVPAEHALVNLSADGSGISGTSRVATTDSNGNFRFPGIPVGRVYISVSNGPGGLTGNAQGFVTGTIEPLPETIINVALTPTATVTGTVYKLGGSEAYTGALVRVTSNGFSVNTTTDEAGRYRVNFVPLGTINVSVESPFGYDRGKSAAITSNQPGATVTADVTMAGVGSINGTASGSDGNPLAFGKVMFTNTAWGEYITVVAPVQSNGSYSMTGLPAGNFSLKLTVPEIVGVGTAADTLSGGQTLVKNLQLEQAGKVFGSVKATDGTTPAVGADVNLTLFKQGGGVYTFITHTDPSGSWAVDNLPLGTISVRFTDPNSGGVANISGLALNSNGQQLDAGSVTLDNTPISVVSVTPENNAVNVPANSTVQVIFSEAVDAGTINSGTFKLNLGINPVNASRAVSTDGLTVTLTPGQNLAQSQEFTVVLTTGVKDRNGLALAQEFTSKFTTADQTPPSVTAINPANGSAEIPLNSKITVTASEALDDAQDLSNLIQVSANSAAVSGTTALDQTKQILEFTPSAGLSDSTSYSVTVNGLKDLSGNTQTNAFNATFRTKDTVAPVVNPLPVDGTTVRNFRPTITATYSDNFSGINISSVVLTVDGTNVTSGATVTGGNLIYTPTANLLRGVHNITLQVADNSGNVSDLRTASFTIDDSGPIITSFTIGGVPVANGVQISSSLTPLFEVNYTDDTGINAAASKLYLGFNGAPPTEVPVTVNNAKLTYQPTLPMADGNYAVRAVITNNLGTATDTGQISFTVDVDAPDIQTVTPNHGNQHGGTAVTLSGSRLLNSNGTAPTVTIGNYPAIIVSAAPGTGGNPDSVVISTPAGVPGSATIELTTDRGIGRILNGFNYEVDPRTPFALENDTLLLWHLDELSNGAARLLDSNYYSIDGTANANSSAAEGKFAGGRTRPFLRSDDDFGVLNFSSQSFTVETWMKSGPVGRTFTIIGKGYLDAPSYIGQNYGSEFLIELTPSGALQARVFSNACLGCQAVEWRAEMLPTVLDIDNNQWHLVTMTVNRQTEQVKLYVDGIERASANKPGNFGNFVRWSSLRLYAGYYNPTQPVPNPNEPLEFPGVLDEIRLSNTAHNSTKILNDYNGTEGGNGLQLFYNSAIVAPRGRTTDVQISGYGLAGVTATANDNSGAPLQTQVVSSSSNAASISITVPQNASVGDTQMSLVSPFGTAALTLRIVDPGVNVFATESDTYLLWHLDESANGAARLLDSGRFSIDGSANANSSAVEGYVGGGRTRPFLRSDDDFSILNFSTQSFTLETWMKSGPVGRTYTLVGKGYLDAPSYIGQNYGSEFLIDLLPSGALQARVFNNACLGCQAVEWRAELPPLAYDVDNNQWHLVTMTVDRQTEQLKLYVDGVERASTNKPGNFGNFVRWTSGIRFYGGYYNQAQPAQGGTTDPLEFPGVLDEIRLSNTAHTAERISRDFHSNSELRITASAPRIVYRERNNPVPVNNQMVIDGYELDNINVQVIKDNQPIDVAASVESGSYRQAVINLAVSPNAPLGDALVVVSKPNQTPVTANIRIIESGQFIVENDTVVLWNLNETANGATLIKDSGLMSVDGISSVNSSAVTGKFQGGRTRPFVQAEDDLGVSNFSTQSFTAAAWFKTGPVGRTYTLVGKSYLDAPSYVGQNYGSDFVLEVLPNGGMQARVFSNACLGCQGVEWKAEISPIALEIDNNQWHLATMTVDRQTEQLKLYVDGIERASANKPGNFGTNVRWHNGLRFFAGYHNNSQLVQGGTTDPVEFPGVIDEIRVSSSAHSAERVALDAVGYDRLRVVRINPSLIQRGVTTSVRVTGNELPTAVVTSTNPEITVTSTPVSDTEITVNLNVSANSALGISQIVFADSTGYSTSAPVTIVDQQPFNPSAETKVLWHLNETTNGATAIVDSGLMSIDGISAANSSAVTGRFAGGRTRSFIRGEDDLGILNLSTQSFTAEAWIKTSYIGRTYTIVGRSYLDAPSYIGQNYGSDFVFEILPNGGLQARLFSNACLGCNGTEWKAEWFRSYDPQTGYWLVDLTDGNWHLLTMTVDRQTEQLKLYVDGVERASANKPGNFGTNVRWHSGLKLYAGYHNPAQPAQGGTTDPIEFPGVLDEVRILNYPRTAQEISDTWFGTNNVFGIASLKPAPQKQTGGKESPPDKSPTNSGSSDFSGDLPPKETRMKRDIQKEERR